MNTSVWNSHPQLGVGLEDFAFCDFKGSDARVDGYGKGDTKAPGSWVRLKVVSEVGEANRVSPDVQGSWRGGGMGCEEVRDAFAAEMECSRKLVFGLQCLHEGRARASRQGLTWKGD